MTNKAKLRALLLAGLITLLSACGGGGVSDPAAPPPPASGQPSSAPPPVQAAATVVSGTLTGFNGVSIDGVDYAEANTTVALDIDPAVETAATMGQLRLGQQVEALADERGQLSKIVVRATVIGPVQSVNVAGGSFVVLGQTVKVVTSGDAMTVFEGVAGLADLKVSDWVEVHGTIDADKNVVATRVEVRPATTAVRAAGLVKNHNAVNKTFELGTLTVNYANATVLPAGATIDNDVLVFVYSDQLPANNQLAAKTVRVARMPSLEGRRFSIGGLVTDVTEMGRKFKVGGLAIDATDPAVELKGGPNPTFADIVPMALVRVEGTLSGSGNAVTLKATRIWIIPASEQRKVQLRGQITDYVSAANFKVRGVSVDADAARFIGGAKADLKDGAFVKVMGRINGAKVVAEMVHFEMPPHNVPFRLFGVVSDYNSTTGEFKLLGIPMQLAPTATFSGGAKADFGNGDVISVRGSFNGTVFVVSEVQFQPSALPPSVYLSGVISNVAATGFTLNGTNVKLTATTQIRNGPLANGQRVEVKARLEGGDIVALEVEVEQTGVFAYLRGPVAELDGAAKTFKIDGQTVDYAAATFTGGAAADLSNGDMVRVTGTLAAGKVMATRIQFLR